MTTRAANIQFLLSGLSNPSTGLPVAGGSVEFYEAGTTTPKYVYTEREKTNGYYTYTLDEVGAATLFGEGEYRVVLKDSSGSTVDTLDPIRLEYPYYGIRTVTSGNTSMVTQDDFILCNTTGGDVTIDCLTAANWVRPLKVKRISGTNQIIIDPYGSETIDSSATLQINSDAVVEIISDGSNLVSAGFRSAVSDADNDTVVWVEKEPDEDTIRMQAGGNERLLIYKSGPMDLYMSGYVYISGAMHVDGYVSGGITIKGGDVIIDEDKLFIGKGLGDTVNKNLKLQVYDSGPYTVYISGGLSVDDSLIRLDTFVNESNGRPCISNNAFAVTTLTEAQYETVGPTGAGKDNEWSALDSVPTSADWIEVKVLIDQGSASGESGEIGVSLLAYEDGGSAGSTESIIASGSDRANSSGATSIYALCTSKIPVSSAAFNLRYSDSSTNAASISMYLVGYGYNS